MDNFDLKKFLVENKLTNNSRNITEIGVGQGVNIDPSGKDLLGDKEETSTAADNQLRQLKPEKWRAIPMPTEYSYRLVYMYSSKPEYQIFLKAEPKQENYQSFLKIAPKPMEVGDGIMVLDKDNKQVNSYQLTRKDITSPGQARPGELSQMTV
jgi:hypothetical protein